MIQLNILIVLLVGIVVFGSLKACEVQDNRVLHGGVER